MKIIFRFVGGSQHETLLIGDSNVMSPDGQPDLATQCYVLTAQGTEGRSFSKPHVSEFEKYKIVNRLENGDCVILRAACEPEAL